MAIYHVKFPLANPVKMVRATNVQDYFWSQEVPSFETQNRQYWQKFEQGDYIQFQMIFRPDKVNSANMLVQLRDCQYNQNYGNFQPTGVAWVYSSNEMAVTFRLNLYNPTIPAGDYYIYLYTPFTVGSNFDLFYSEPIEIKADHPNTVLLNYTNRGHDFDMFFYKDFAGSENLYFQMRVEGGFRSDGFQPASIDSQFNDQTHNATLLSSVPYNVRKITFGDNHGLPEWMPDKINRILSCTDVTIDGVAYCKSEGAKLEPRFIFNHPLAAWKIDLVKTSNDYVDPHVQYTKPGSGGIGTMEVEENFTISENIILGPVAQVINNGMTKPKPFPIPELVANVDALIEHNLGLPYYIWQIQGATNEAQLAVCKPDPANPTTKFIVRSKVAIPASTLTLVLIGFYEY